MNAAMPLVDALALAEKHASEGAAIRAALVIERDALRERLTHVENLLFRMGGTGTGTTAATPGEGTLPAKILERLKGQGWVSGRLLRECLGYASNSPQVHIACSRLAAKGLVRTLGRYHTRMYALTEEATYPALRT